MYYKRFYAGLICLLILTFFSVIKADIRWIDKEFDYGVIYEEDGKQEGEVKFINEGEFPTYIAEVRTGCGCTDAVFSSGLISPGDTAVIKFSYNPLGRPGKFKKSIKAWFGDDREYYTFNIRGNVVPSASLIESYYPFTVGQLRFETLTEKAGEILKGDRRYFFINLYNPTENPVFVEFKKIPEPVKISMDSQTIAPYESEHIKITWDTFVEEKDGLIEHEIITETGIEGEKVSGTSVIKISGLLVNN